jgi:hypothetical protein
MLSGLLDLFEGDRILRIYPAFARKRESLLGAARSWVSRIEADF